MHQHTLHILGPHDVTSQENHTKDLFSCRGFCSHGFYGYEFISICNNICFSIWNSLSNITNNQFPEVCCFMVFPLSSQPFSLQASLFHIDAVLEHPQVSFQNLGLVRFNHTEETHTKWLNWSLAFVVIKYEHGYNMLQWYVCPDVEVEGITEYDSAI